MYSAIDEQDLHFHLIHEPDGGRIGYQKFCKKEEKLVPTTRSSRRSRSRRTSSSSSPTRISRPSRPRA
jgi:hypothetical protein